MGRLLIFSIIFSSCYSFPPEYQIYNIDVYFAEGVGPTREHMLQATDFFIFSFAEFSETDSDKLFKLLQEIHTIEWYSNPILYNNKQYNGLDWGFLIQIRLIDGCIYKSAYFHELFHNILRQLGIKNDIDMVDDDWSMLNARLKSTAKMLYGCKEENKNEEL